MKFNDFLWNNYKISKDGETLSHFFQNYSLVYVEKEYQTIYKKLVEEIQFEKPGDCYDLEYFEILKLGVENIRRCLEDNGENNGVRNIEEAEIFFSFVTNLVWDEGDHTEYLFDFSDVPFLSEILYLLYPDFFFPYYFSGNFHDLVKICNEFNIFLPPIPLKKDKDKRLRYYFELCHAFYNFRRKYNLDSYELPLFIYGFALRIIDKTEIPLSLPKPLRAYFVGGGKKDQSVDVSDDFEYLDKADESTFYRWNGHADTQPGDIILMYCLSPRSYIHSIWRAITPGYVNPFFNFYSYMYIGYPQRITPIYLDELKNDSILSQMPLVKGNMQGINGRLIDQKFYNRIIELLSEKQNISSIPLMNEYEAEVDHIANEKDVEQKLLEPLLEKLGYIPSQWKRQLSVRMGRGERNYPDYVIHPVEERNNESGYWVWEAKYSIQSQKQLQEDFGQAKSYALRLKCKGLSLISKEGIWLCQDDFDFHKLQYWPWAKIYKNDSFNQIFTLAGYKRQMC